LRATRLFILASMMNIVLALLLGLVGVLAASVLYEAIVAARQLGCSDGRLRLKDVARARGLALRPTRTHAAMTAHARAVRRCLSCWRQKRCDQLALANEWLALAEICPNRAYLDSLPLEACAGEDLM
jgi:hypothetical protein